MTHPTWKAALNTALVGTARQPFSVPTEDGQLGQVLAGLQSETRESDLLGVAGAIALYQNVGQLPAKLDLALSEPCPPEDREVCNSTAANYLGRILGGEYQSCLSEWLTLAGDRDLRVPEFYLPDLLDAGRKSVALRKAIAPVLGIRGRWLAEQNAAWNYAAAGTEDNFPEQWETGTIATRLATLTAWRERDSETARHALAETWKQDSAGDRAKFLGALEVNLSLDDEPFLETALGDRSKQVRQVAAQLLGTLPESQLSQRMADRASEWLALVDGNLSLNFPDSLSSELQAEGIQERGIHRGKKANWFAQVVSYAPPKQWSDAFARSPAELIQLARATDWSALLIGTWTEATQRYGDRDWARALLSLVADDTVGHVVMPCFEVLPVGEREAIAIELLQMPGETWRLAVERVIPASQHAWSMELARAAIAGCRKLMKPTKSTVYAGGQLLMTCARYAPPSFVNEPEVGELWNENSGDRYKQRSVANFRDLLAFRLAMTSAFDTDR